MKKTYIQPTTVVAEIQQQHIICGTRFNALGGGIFDYEGAGDGSDQNGGKPRSRQHNVWDEDWDEE